MNLQQLRIVRETVRQDFNLTEVANALFTSQPGVSKHIKDLEDELGVALFERKGKRLLGLTAPGRELVPVVERLLQDASNIRRIADEFAQRDHGDLIIAATHTQARYALPEVIRRFKAAHPRVHLVLHQGSPREIAELLQAGEADLAIATEALDQVADFATFPCYTWHHALLVPNGHPLAGTTPTLAELARHPIVTYHAGFTGRSHIDAAFAAASLTPDVVLSAIDADVIKTYVELGLGVGIVAAMAYQPDRDRGLTQLDAQHLFAPNVTRLAVRRGAYLRSYAYRFIEELVPGLSESALRPQVEGYGDAAGA